jgi:hypothetical protein
MGKKEENGVVSILERKMKEKGLGSGEPTVTASIRRNDLFSVNQCDASYWSLFRVLFSQIKYTIT